uniref:Uncharacterized protein n=1 Tax=Knipowitschia caucasica TaxID=637954 RepID=A0AAV2K3N2_KNICA
MSSLSEWKQQLSERKRREEEVREQREKTMQALAASEAQSVYYSVLGRWTGPTVSRTLVLGTLFVTRQRRSHRRDDDWRLDTHCLRLFDHFPVVVL